MTDTQLTATGLLASLGAEIPLVAAPMAGGPSTPALVVAAADAGGLGFLAAGYTSPDELAGLIAQVRRRTGLFGVNLFAPNPTAVSANAYARYREALLPLARGYGVELPQWQTSERDDDSWDAKLAVLTRAPVPVVSFTFGIPSAEVVARLHAVGTLTAQSVTTAAEAALATERGVDALVVQSYAAGGHSATTTPAEPVAEIAIEQLLADVRRASDLPVWAAGGIVTPEQVRLAIAAGAEAVAVGTVLVRSPESGASAAYKRALAELGEGDTVLTTAFSGRPARALRNAFTEGFTSLAPLGYPAIHFLTSPIRRAATQAGDIDAINVWAGTGHREARPDPAAQILRRLAGEGLAR
ncbi:MAG: nitronate monooxygenase [Tetrasphaera sp.]